MSQELRPADVFVPGRFPVEESNAYADRGAPQDRARRALDRCYVPLVYGGYGVGKSSMIMKLAQGFRQESNVVYIESAFGKELEDIFRAVLEKINYEVTIQRTASTGRTVSGTVEGEIGGGMFQVLTAKIRGVVSGEDQKGETRVLELVVRSPTESKLLDLFEENNILLVIDELHQASPTLTKNLSAFLKAYANKNCTRFRVALLGTENDASRLVISDPGTDRLIEEVALPPLRRAEAESVIDVGFSRLKIRVEADAREALIIYSVGSPFVLQFLCLEVAETSWGEKRRPVTKDDVGRALASYAERKAQRLIRAYRAAIETTGQKRYRKQILIAMANSPDEYVTMEYLVDKISKALGESVPSTALSGPLRQLKTEEYAKILRDVDAPAGGGRIANYSAFSDPGMKAVIRMVESGGINND